jgi:hypothetical protein
MELIPGVFEVDRRFGSLDEAADFLMHEYLQELPARVWRQGPFGLLAPDWAPKYLFRGECGDYPTTLAGVYRSGAYSLRDGRRLTPADQDVLGELLPLLARRFSDTDYSLDEHSAIGLLQHYGLPTWLVDFTYDAGHAIAFAATGSGTVGRMCVLPTAYLPARGPIAAVDLTEHRWCERPRRQRAFGVIMPRDYPDLKNREVRRASQIRWYEFPISDEDRSLVRERYANLVRLDDDPSAGFLRHHLTEYVEARGKLSPLLTDWLLAHVPIVPRCAEVIRFDGSDVVVHHRPSSVIGEVDVAIEENWSRRYWSTAYVDSSWDRMTDWKWPPIGTVYADPRTLHRSLPSH